MPARTVTQQDAVDMLVEWEARRLHPLCGAGPAACDDALEPACDEFLRWLADDPDQDLSEVPRDLLLLTRRRIAWGVAAATLEPGRVIMRVPDGVPERVVLQALIGGLLAGTRVPKPLNDPGSPEPPAGSFRKH